MHGPVIWLADWHTAARLSRGGEIAATLMHMAAFANLAGVVSTPVDSYHEATLGDEAIVQFSNPTRMLWQQCVIVSASFMTGLWQTDAIRSRSSWRYPHDAAGQKGGVHLHMCLCCLAMDC